MIGVPGPLLGFALVGPSGVFHRAEKGEMVSQMTIEPCWVYTEVVHRGTWLRMPFTFQI